MYNIIYTVTACRNRLGMAEVAKQDFFKNFYKKNTVFRNRKEKALCPIRRLIN